MSNIVKRGNYLFFPDPAVVRWLYGQRVIVPNPVLNGLLPASATQPTGPDAVWATLPPKSLRWAFEDRAATPRYPALATSPFAGLFLYQHRTDFPPPTGAGSPGVTLPSSVQIGSSGSGNLPPWDALEAGTPVVVDLGPDLFPDGVAFPIPDLAPHVQFPDLNPATILDAVPARPLLRPLTGFSPALPVSSPVALSVPRIAYIAPTKVSVTDLRATHRRLHPHSSREVFFDYLSTGLTLADIDDHGQQSVAVAAYQSPGSPIAYISADYPYLLHSSENPAKRFGMAFSSPTVLNLGAGDVLFINQSFAYKDSSGVITQVPVLFDLVVYHLTVWLEKQGVTVIFSVGDNIHDLNPIIGQYLTVGSPLPGLLIGGYNPTPTPSHLTSNYGDCLTCVAPPTNLTSGAGGGPPYAVRATGTSFGKSSGATAYVAGLVTALQTAAHQQSGRYLAPADIRNWLQSNAHLVGGQRIVPSLADLKRLARLRP
jgi:hypothetical protein